jgi:hypothetical protein
MVKFFETKNRVALEQIREVERFVGLNFPEAYKLHLLENNGGRCEPDTFTFVENGRITDSCVAWFFAIYDGRINNLSDSIETYKIREKRLPAHMLPFADDPFGNLICLSCGSKDYGCVYFWDHEREVDYQKTGDNDYSNLYLIANSFEMFISTLKKNPWINQGAGSNLAGQ